jgi:hypothetical protein
VGEEATSAETAQEAQSHPHHPGCVSVGECVCVGWGGGGVDTNKRLIVWVGGWVGGWAKRNTLHLQDRNNYCDPAS